MSFSPHEPTLDHGMVDEASPRADPGGSDMIVGVPAPLTVDPLDCVR